MGRASSTQKEYRLPPPIKGVVTRFADTKLPAGAYSMLQNIEHVKDVGIFAVRQGTARSNTTPTSGAFPVRGGIRWYYGSGPTAETIFGHNTKLYKLAASPTQIGTTTFTANKEWFFASFVNYLYCTNGTDAMVRWDGSTLRSAGFPAPGSTATVATGAAGALTGAYQYKVTFVYDSDASHESTASSASSVVNPAAQKVDLSSIPTGGASSGVTSRRIYRTKAGGTLFYFLTTIADNTTTTYTDNAADSTLTSEQAPNDNGVPPAVQFLKIKKGRAVGAKTTSFPYRLYFSAIGSTERAPVGTLSIHGAGVEIWPADHYIDIGDSNTPITGIEFWGDSIVVFKEDEIYLVRGVQASDFDVWDVAKGVGCVAPRTIVNMGRNEGIYFLGRNELTPTVYSFDGGDVRPISDAVEPYFRTQIVGLGGSYTVQPCAGKYRGQYLLSYMYSSSTNPFQIELAKYDTRKQSWAFDLPAGAGGTLSASCWIPYTGTGDAGEMYFGHAAEGTIVRYDYLGGDFRNDSPTTPYSSAGYIETGWMDLGSPYQMKEIKEIFIIGESQATATISVERRFDFKASGSVTQVQSLAMAATITGTGVFVKRIANEQEGADISNGSAVETGYFVKLCITINAPYANEAAAFLPIKIHDIVIVYNELPPVGHDG